MIECTDCGLSQEEPVLAVGQSAFCRRCDARLARYYRPGYQTSAALSLAALALLVVANTKPFLNFAFHGRQTTDYLWSGIQMLWEAGYEPLSLLVGGTVIFVPLFLVSGVLVVSSSLALGYRAAYLAKLYRWLRKLRSWAMLEVFLLGVLVAVVKLGDLASIGLGIGFYAFVASSLLMLGSWETLDPRAVWKQVDVSWVSHSAAEGKGSLHLLACPVCDLQSSPPPEASAFFACPRCGERLHDRKPYSVQGALSLLLAAAILYTPANMLPVMKVELLGSSETDTILQGVQALIAGGLWEIAALVFFASFLVPGLKILGLLYLAWTVRHPDPERLVLHTRLYRVIEQVGRWSMIDVFMTAVLVGLVQLGAIATILPGAGAVCFAAVVVLTLYAARAFDPRVLWDSVEEQDA